jgi:hypothetical protein
MPTHRLPSRAKVIGGNPGLQHFATFRYPLGYGSFLGISVAILLSLPLASVARKDAGGRPVREFPAELIEDKIRGGLVGQLLAT